MNRTPTIISTLRELASARRIPSVDRHPAVRIGFVGNVPEPIGGAEIFLRDLVSHLTDKVEAIAISRCQRQWFRHRGVDTVLTYREAPVVESDDTGKLSTYYLYRFGAGGLLERLRCLSDGLKTADSSYGSASTSFTATCFIQTSISPTLHRGFSEFLYW